MTHRHYLVKALLHYEHLYYIQNHLCVALTRAVNSRITPITESSAFNFLVGCSVEKFDGNWFNTNKRLGLVNIKLFIKRSKLLCIASILGFNLSAHAAEYYVDKNHRNASDDNSGTAAQPWKTLQKAADSVAAGDTVFVKNGVYNESMRLKTSGSPGKYITFQNFPGHTPIVDGTNVDKQKLIDWRGSPSKGIDKNYIILDGFEVRNAKFWAIWVEGNHSIIRNCVVHDTGHTGIIAIDSDYLTVSHNEIYNTGWNGMSLESGNYATVEYNISRNNPLHFGINIFPKTSWEQIMETGNNIRFNTLYGNMGGIYTRYQQDNEIVGNLIYKNLEYGIFFHSGAGGPLEYNTRTKVYQNTVSDNIKGGIYNVNANYLTIKNNIFSYHAVHDRRYELQMNKIIGHDIDYNLYYTLDPKKEIVYWGGPKYDIEGFRKATPHSDNGVFAKPQYINKSADNYNLSNRSPAIDNGVNLGIEEKLCGSARLTDGEIDLGACEYASNGQFAPVAPRNIKAEIEQTN